MNKWKQRDGYTIFIKDMSAEHLQNSINMLQKRIDNLEYVGSAIPDSADFALAEDAATLQEPYRIMKKNLEKELKCRSKKSK